MALPALGTMLLLSGLASGLDYLGARKRQRQFNQLRRAEDQRQARYRTAAEEAYAQSLPRYEAEEYQQREEEAVEDFERKLKQNQAGTQLTPGLAPKPTGETKAFEVAERGRERAYTDALAEARARLRGMGDVFLDYGLSDADINRALAEQSASARGSWGVFSGIEGPQAMSERNIFDLGSLLTRAGSAAYGLGMFGGGAAPGAPAISPSNFTPTIGPAWARTPQPMVF